IGPLNDMTKRALNKIATETEGGRPDVALITLSDIEREADLLHLDVLRLRVIRLQGDCHRLMFQPQQAREQYQAVWSEASGEPWNSSLAPEDWPAEAVAVFPTIRSNERRKEFAHAVRGLAGLAHLEGRWERAAELFDKADSFFGSVMPTGLDGKARVAIGRAEMFRSQGRVLDARSAISAVNLPKDAMASLRARVEFTWGRLEYGERKYNEAATHFEEALRILTDLQEDLPFEEALRRLRTMPVNAFALCI
ncbi:unnamed protein product, partial [marine sediment metagenome]